jgi:8-oxo-dGTP diphosphatase
MIVAAVRHLGERVHPLTGTTITYVVCQVLDGPAHAAEPAAITELAWGDRATLATYVRYPLFPPVQEHLDAALA